MHSEFGRSKFLACLLITQGAQKLAKSGAIDDARWVLDVGREQLPDFFSMRTLTNLKEYKSQPSPRPATGREISLGLVDKDGYFLRDPEGSARRRSGSIRDRLPFDWVEQAGVARSYYIISSQCCYLRRTWGAFRLRSTLTLRRPRLAFD